MKDKLTTNVHSEQVAPPDAKPLLPAVFSADEMIAFGNFIRDNYYVAGSPGNFIRDNYYVAGSPKMLSYHPEKYPHAKVDEIFVYWCLENGR